MEIQHKRGKFIIEVSHEDWQKMLSNNLSRNYKVVNATDKAIAKRLTEPPIEVVDFLKESKSVVMADDEPEEIPTKKRKVKGWKAANEVSQNDEVAKPQAATATEAPDPALTYQPIELAHEEPLQTFENIEFTDNQIVS